MHISAIFFFFFLDLSLFKRQAVKCSKIAPQVQVFDAT